MYIALTSEREYAKVFTHAEANEWYNRIIEFLSTSVIVSEEVNPDSMTYYIKELNGDFYVNDVV